MAYTSLEEQELNEIKSWWKENYKVIISAAILGIAGVSGWRFWQSHQQAQAEQMSAQYEQILFSQQDDVAKNAQIEAFVKENGKTAYAALALLGQAKQAVLKQDYAQAENLLSQANAQAPDQIFASIAAIRLAQVQLQQQKLDEAQASLNLVKDATWEAQKTLLAAEIALAKGDKAAAKQGLQSVLQTGSALEQQQAQVRLNNL